MGFTSLAHLMDIDWLHQAYRRTRRDGATGRVDGMTPESYAANPESATFLQHGGADPDRTQNLL
jgi:hypothetical protein